MVVVTAVTKHPCDAAKGLISYEHKVLGAEKTRCEGVPRRWLLERGWGGIRGVHLQLWLLKYSCSLGTRNWRNCLLLTVREKIYLEYTPCVYLTFLLY